MLCRDRVQRFFHALAGFLAEILLDEDLSSCIHDIRMRIMYHISEHALRNPAQRVRLERRRPVKNRRAWDIPIYTLSSRPVRFRRAGAVRPCRPDNRLTVTARDEKKALPDRWRAVIAGTKLTVFDLVPSSCSASSSPLQQSSTLR